MTARRTGPDADTVERVRARDGWRCLRCGTTDCGPMTTQHRVARGMGGTKAPGINLPSNLITLGGSGTTGCHGWVEAHPKMSRAHGWSVPRWDTPATVPVWTWRGWVLIDDDYGLWGDPSNTGVDGCDCGCQLGRAA